MDRFTNRVLVDPSANFIFPRLTLWGSLGVLWPCPKALTPITRLLMTSKSAPLKFENMDGLEVLKTAADATNLDCATDEDQ